MREKTWSKEHLHILHHSLGISEPLEISKQKPPYRNHFVTEPRGKDFELLKDLEKAGLVERQRHSLLRSKQWCFHCTDEGKRLASTTRPTLKLTRDQRRYDNFLEMSDVDQDLTFRKFLTDPQYEEFRR